MKVLHIISSMDPVFGGVSQAVRTIIGGLSALGVSNEVVCLDHPDASYIKDSYIKLHAVGPYKGPWWYSSALLPWLTENMSYYDIVIVHGLWLYHSYAANKAARLLKKRGGDAKNIPKVFVMPHGMLDPYFQKDAGRKMKAIRNRIYWALIEKNVVNDADAILFTCETERILASEPFKPYHPQNEITVGLGIDSPPAFNLSMRTAFKLKCPEIKERPYLLFLSRIHEKKGVDILVEAYDNIHKRIKNKEIPQLIIAGPGIETEFGKKIKSFVDGSSNICSKVFFPGMLSGDAKWAAFYDSEAFILPSHQENFGIAIVEALACSTPVLISNQINIWREIEAEKGGIVSKDDIESVEKMLMDWMNMDPEPRAEMAENACGAYKKYFTVEAVSHKLFTTLG